MVESLKYIACCPKCGTAIYEPDWICPVCDGKIYSQYYGKYIDLDQTIYSKTHSDYFYKQDLVYSQYYDDFIRKDIAVEVYNMETDEMDYVPEDKSVYSTYYEKHLIFAQTVYSFYYDTYLYADPERTAFSKYLNSYIDIGDDNIVETEDDYIPKNALQNS